MKKIIELDFDISDNDISCIQIITTNGSIYRGHILTTINNYMYEMNYNGKIKEIKDIENLGKIQFYKNEIELSLNPNILFITINLNNCYINDMYLEHIIRCWMRPEFKPILNKLKVIRLNGNKIKINGYKFLFQFIERYCPMLHELDTNITSEDYKLIKKIIPEDINVMYLMN